MAVHTDDLQSIKERYNYYERNDIIMYFWRESFKASLFSERLFNLVPYSNQNHCSSTFQHKVKIMYTNSLVNATFGSGKKSC